MKPALNSPMALPGPKNIARIQLPNGLTLLTRSNMESPSVIITGYFMAGAIYEPDEKLGLAHFTALSLMRGTQARSFHKVFTDLENIGASLSFGASIHTASFSCRSLIEDLPILLKLIFEVLTTPTFPASQVEKLRTQFITGLTIREQDTSEMSSLEFDKLLYAGHPYGRPEDGYMDTIRSISRDDLSQFHSHHYGPRGAVIALVGAMDRNKALDLIADAFGNWTNPRQPVEPKLPSIRPPRGIQTKHTAIPGKSQIDLVMGTLGPSRLSADYYSASIGNNILGQFGMMGRIGEVVREKAGLAYYAYSNLSAGVGPGSWEFIAGVNPANLKKTIPLIQNEIKRFLAKPVKVSEIEDVKAYFCGRLPLALESNSGVASALINIERYQLGLDYYLRYASTIQAVSREDILETARKYLDVENMVISTAGTLE